VKLTIAKNRWYLAGIAKLYKKFGLIQKDRLYNLCRAVWKWFDDKNCIKGASINERF